MRDEDGKRDDKCGVRGRMVFVCNCVSVSGRDKENDGYMLLSVSASVTRMYVCGCLRGLLCMRELRV